MTVIGNNDLLLYTHAHKRPNESECKNIIHIISKTNGRQLVNLFMCRHIEIGFFPIDLQKSDYEDSR